MMLGARAPLLEGGGEFPHAHKASPPRCCFWLASHVNVRKCVAGVMLLAVLTIVFYTYYVTVRISNVVSRKPLSLWLYPPLSPQYHAAPEDSSSLAHHVPATSEHSSEMCGRTDTGMKVLLVVETTESELGIDIAGLLRVMKIQYEKQESKDWSMTNAFSKKHGVIVFESLSIYADMDELHRALLEKYCRDHSVGIVGLARPGEERSFVGLQMEINLRLKNATINPASPVLRLTRDGGTVKGPLTGECWSVFRTNTSTYEPVAWALHQNDKNDNEDREKLAIVVQDRGKLDGVQKVFFGSGLQFWLLRLMFLDTLSYLGRGQFNMNLDRWMLIDIDNVFVKARGTRFHEEDVQALLTSQESLQRLVPGFRFNLGFNGNFYHNGTMLENLGDDALLKHKKHFTWFGQIQILPHLYNNVSVLEAEMMMNKQFAVDHGIPTNSSYSVTRHYSGIYPVHQPLYDAWKKVWDVKVTSTEEYPRSQPVIFRRGFRYKDIMVLPRQPNLLECIQSGILLQTIITNPINVFTMQVYNCNCSNYRMALYLLELQLKFLKRWTNLKLKSSTPLVLAEKYFQLRADEREPLWGYPCPDHQQKRLWSKRKWCFLQIMPKFLIIGPQKAGSTDLYTLMTMHPGLAANLPSPHTNEELQFFNSHNYFKGLDWYMSFFPWTLINFVTRHTFEKSSTYFDGVEVPRRAHALLPLIDIVVVLVSPSERAYSWYQHIRSHGDPVANNYTFHTVITANDSAPKTLRDLRTQCLSPGEYSRHLERWLHEYSDQQVHIVDGTLLRSDPVSVMSELQNLLLITPVTDYSTILQHDTEGDFFCQRIRKTKCIGESDGRSYPLMEEKSQMYLREYYTPHNTALSKLLVRLGRPVPPWLKDELSSKQSSNLQT